jgi:hypothetical protein
MNKLATLRWIYRFAAAGSLLICIYTVIFFLALEPEAKPVAVYRLFFLSLLFLVLSAAAAIALRRSEWRNSPKKRRLRVAAGLVVVAISIMVLFAVFGGLFG